MDPLKSFDGLSECINHAIQEHFAKSNIDLPHDLAHPVLRVEAFLEDEANEEGNLSPRSARIASSKTNLARFVTPAPSRSAGSSPVEQQIRSPADSEVTDDEATPGSVDSSLSTTNRRGIGGLHVSQTQSFQEDLSEHQRQMVSDGRTFPKRRKTTSEIQVFRPSTLDKLILGIWENLHGSLTLDTPAIFEQFQDAPATALDALQRLGDDGIVPERTTDAFQRMNLFCQKVTQTSRVCRSIEIIVQARWSELFEEQVQLRIAAMPQVSPTRNRKAAFMEACKTFGWSEQELRNKMAIWRGYKEIKDAAGWVGLVFAGMGIYRFCKYRVEFSKDAMKRLQNLRKRFEVAADTLHPNWRQILSLVGVSSSPQYTGHPHDWVVFEDGSDPVPLRSTYLQQDPCFDFEQLEESVIDESVWRCDDPRWVPQSNALIQTCGTYVCACCGERQSDDPASNSCYCYPTLFGCVQRRLPQVQVFRTTNNRNNGLIALTPFERGTAIGEFVGSITKGIRHLDVMDNATASTNYQIWQGRQGNFTRFINHSCKANAQFAQFTWLDTQRIILVSKGIQAGDEIFVDYGHKYWAGLDKECLCREPCCRYSQRSRSR